MKNTAILLMHCRDQTGLVAAVTDFLHKNNGPIIAQDVAHITHKDNIADLVRKGKDLEKLVLSRAVWLHIQHKALPYQNRTIVF